MHSSFESSARRSFSARRSSSIRALRRALVEGLEGRQLLAAAPVVVTATLGADGMPTWWARAART